MGDYDYKSIRDKQIGRELVFKIGVYTVAAIVAVPCVLTGNAPGALLSFSIASYVCGSTSVTGAITGTNPISGRTISSDERWVEGISGSIQVLSGAYGIYSYAPQAFSNALNTPSPPIRSVADIVDDVNNGAGEGASGTGKSIVTPEMEDKILEGHRVGTTNRVIGGHSPNINNANPNYASETLKTYSDGTKQIKYVKQFTDGNISKIKTSTIFPDGWSESKIISSIKEVGNGSPIGYRVRDGATIFRSTIDGIQVEVIKIGDSVISGYPTGGGATGLPAGFSGK